MQVTRRLAALCVGSLIVGLVAGVGLLAAPAGGGVRLLEAEEAASLMGGSCPNEDCVDENCDTSQCPTQERECTKKGYYCIMVKVTPFAKCAGKHENKKCSHKGLLKACAEVVWGMPDMKKQTCLPGSCGSPYTTCGPQKYECAAEACDDQD